MHARTRLNWYHVQCCVLCCFPFRCGAFRCCLCEIVDVIVFTPPIPLCVGDARARVCVCVGRGGGVWRDVS